MPSAETVRITYTYYDGTLSEIAPEYRDGEAVALTAVITRTIAGQPISSPIRLAQERFGALAHMFAPGRAALCGILEDGVLQVLGPDLRRRTLLKAEAEAYRPRRADRTPARIARDRFFARRHYAKLKAERTGCDTIPA